MKKIIIALTTAFITFAFTSVYAGSFNVGVTGAIAKIAGDGKETTSAGDSGTANSNTASAEHKNVPIGSYYLEYESDFYGITLGFEHTPGSADVNSSVKSRQDIENSVTGDETTNTGTRDFKAQAEVENYTNLYVEIPVYNSFFVRAGMASIDVNTLEVKSSNGGSYGNAGVDGINYGIGLKGDLSDNLAYKFFYETTEFDSLSLTSTGNSVTAETNKVTADLDVSSVKFAIGYRF